MKFFTFSNFLVFIRLILSPLMLPIFLVYLLPYNILWINVLLGLFFLTFSLTDFLDGYLVRRWKQETSIGKVIDPLADKFLTYSTLIALLAAHKIYFYWVIILIGRALFVTGIRLAAFEEGFNIRVLFWGKLNTIVQMAYLTLVIINPYQKKGFQNYWNQLELGLLVVVILLTLFSVERYLNLFLKKCYQSKEVKINELDFQ